MLFFLSYSVKIIFVTGGGDVTVASTTDTTTFSNIRFEVGGYSNLYFDVPELIMTGIENSVSERCCVAKCTDGVPLCSIAVLLLRDERPVVSICERSDAGCSSTGTDCP